MKNRDIERLIAASCGGRGGFLRAIKNALRGTGESLGRGSSGGTIFPGNDDAYGVSYNLSGGRVLTLRITVEEDK